MKPIVTISVITVTYNCCATLEKCLASVAAQTWLHREHVIIDGASIDGTLNIIKQHRKQIDFFMSEPDDGIYDALNKGLRSSKGDVIGFLHADDEYADNAVLSIIAKEFEDETVDAVYGDLVFVSMRDNTKIIRAWKSSPFKAGDLERGWMPPHPTLYVRRKWYLEANEFCVNYSISADYLSILRLFSQANFKAKYLPKVLVKMRIGGVSNRNIKSILQKSKEDWCILRSCEFSLFDSAYILACKNLRKIGQFFSPNQF